MSLIVPDEGERWFINQLFRDEVPADQVMRLKLFRNDWTPNRESRLVDALEANYSGYAPKDLFRSVWTPAVTVDGRGQTTYGTTFLEFLALAGSQTVYGYYVTDMDVNVLLWVERFATPITVTPVSAVVMLPVMRLRSEYEPAPPP